MKVKDIGEFGLIDRLTGLLAQSSGVAPPTDAGFPLVIGIGDDAAAWHTRDSTELSTTDTAVEGIHFTRHTTPWEDLGWKVMVANLSDIAAMGGTPLYALVTLGLPEDTFVADMEALYTGIAQACEEHGSAVAGGDIVKSPTFFVSITLNGFHQGTPMTRSAAQLDDLLAVTGPLGSSRGGLDLMTQDLSLDEAAADYLRRAHRRPWPRLREGRILVAEGVVAAMDISDGLVDDLGKMMASTGLSADLEASRVPVHPMLHKAFPDGAVSMALAGGEDYELLFAAPEPVMARALARLTTATVVGRVIAGGPGQVNVLDRDGKAIQDPSFGWDHFRS